MAAWSAGRSSKIQSGLTSARSASARVETPVSTSSVCKPAR